MKLIRMKRVEGDATVALAEQGGRTVVVLSDRVTFSGEASEAEQMMTIFLRRVNETAVKQGVLPDPLQGTVGAVSAEKYFEAINQLRRFKGPVEITATATENVFSAGPLRIDIQIRSALSPTSLP